MFRYGSFIPAWYDQLSVNDINSNCDTGFVPPSHIVLSLRNREAVALCHLLCTIYSPHDSHYICFSLVVESGHKMSSLTLSLGVWGLEAAGVKWVLSCGSWSKSCRENETSDQFMTIISMCEVIPEVSSCTHTQRHADVKHTHLHLLSDWLHQCGPNQSSVLYKKLAE